MKRAIVALLACSYVAAMGLALRAQEGGDGARFDGKSLVRPADYREWVFLASGLGMTYNPPNASGQTPPQFFTNVFVNPSAYKGFLQTGHWPNGTVLMLEIRASASEGSINKGGHYQTDVVGIEAHVKDSRLPDGWAFFNFGRGANLQTKAEPLAAERAAPCVECHTKNAAVERTFVQFYPTLIDTAKKMGTYREP